MLVQRAPLLPCCMLVPVLRAACAPPPPSPPPLQGCCFPLSQLTEADMPVLVIVTISDCLLASIPHRYLYPQASPAKFTPAGSGAGPFEQKFELRSMLCFSVRLYAVVCVVVPHLRSYGALCLWGRSSLSTATRDSSPRTRGRCDQQLWNAACLQRLHSLSAFLRCFERCLLFAVSQRRFTLRNPPSLAFFASADDSDTDRL